MRGFFSVLRVTALMVWMRLLGDHIAGMYPLLSFGAVDVEEGGDHGLDGAWS